MNPAVLHTIKCSSSDVMWRHPEDVIIEDANLANWLLDTNSLTERLQSNCQDFAVEVIAHQRETPRDDELALLNCDPRDSYIREVVLIGDNRPWVFARSVIPSVIQNSELDGLGSQPLGKRIFNDPRFRRGQFQVCQLNWQAGGNIYGRRSCFEFLGARMSVAELFLPECPAYLTLR